MQTSYAWLAGILDGEGCFTFFRKSYKLASGGTNKSVTPNITITNSSAAIIDESARLLTAAGVKYTRLCPRNSHTRPLARLSIRNYQSILRLLDTAGPYLVGKAEQAALMRTFVERAQTRGALVTDERDGYHAKMSQLNRTGNMIL